MTSSPNPSSAWAATEAADRAAEAVRTLNHLAGWDGYREPADVAAVLADLARLAYGLPQALSTAGRWLTDQNRAGRLGHDQVHAGVDVTAAVRQLDVDLLAAVLAARQLAASLNAAHQSAAHFLTVTPDHDPDPDAGTALDAEDRPDLRGGAA